MFSCEYCEIFKNTYFEEHLGTAASRKICQWPDLDKNGLIKVAPRVEKTEVFRKSWNFANRTYFASCIMRKHYFLLWTKETAFFPYFYHGIIFYSAELFDCVVNFKLYLNIFMSLNINANQTSKEQYLSNEAAAYFGISRTKRFCNFTDVLSFTSVFEDSDRKWQNFLWQS